MRTNLSMSLPRVKLSPRGLPVQTVRVLLNTVTVEKGKVDYWFSEYHHWTKENPIYLLWLI